MSSKSRHHAELLCIESGLFWKTLFRIRHPFYRWGALGNQNICVQGYTFIVQTVINLIHDTRHHCTRRRLIHPEGFHSRGQHLCKFIGTKESICIRKEFNSHRTGLGHQHGRRFIVLEHQYGRRDVMWKHSIRLNQCCTKFKSPGVKILCVLCLHYVAFTFKWYGNSWNKTICSQRVWRIGLWGKQVKRNCKCKKWLSSLFILDDKKYFHVKDDYGKLWLEMHVATFLNAAATVYVLAANNNDLISVETRAVHFAWLLNYRLVLI